MSKDRGIPSLLLMYFSIIGTLILGMGLGAAHLMETPSQGVEARRSASLLDERIATARKIKASLARPQAPLAPLPPITARLAKQPGQISVVQSAFDAPRKPKTPPEALNAMAMQIQGSGGSSRLESPPDRGGIGGW